MDISSENFVAPKIKNDLTDKFAGLIQGKKVYVAIDAANLYYAALKAKIYLNFEQIYKWFTKNTKYVEIGFYTAYNVDDTKQLEFLKQIESYGYTLICKPIKIFSNNKVKGNMDIEIAVDILRKENDFDTFVLLSGDGDFRYLINNLKKPTIVLSIGGFTSFYLHQDADNYFFLNRVSAIWKSRKKQSNKIKIDESYLIFVDEVDYPEQSIPQAKKNLNKITKLEDTKPKKPKIKLKVCKLDPKMNID